MANTILSGNTAKNYATIHATEAPILASFTQLIADVYEHGHRATWVKDEELEKIQSTLSRALSHEVDALQNLIFYSSRVFLKAYLEMRITDSIYRTYSKLLDELSGVFRELPLFNKVVRI